MAGNIGETVHDSILLLFKDSTLLVLAIIFAIITSAIAYISATTVLSSISSIQSSLAASSAPHRVVLIILDIVGKVFTIDLLAGLLSLFFMLTIMTRAFYGRKKGASQSMSRALGRYIYALALLILIGIGISIPAAVLAVLSAVVPFLAILFILYFIGVAYVAIRISVSMPLVVSGKGPIDSLRLSWDATQGSWWYIFLSYLIVAIILWVIVGIIEIPWISGIIASSIAAHAAVGASANATATSAVLQAEHSAYSSPYVIVVSLVSAFLNFWLTILPVVIYKQLTSGAGKGRPKSKQKQAK